MHLLYRNELDKACFKHDAAYAKYKDVENRLISDQKLRSSEYNAYIASNSKYDGYQRGLGNAKPTTCSSLERTENNTVLAEELHKPVIKNFNKRKVYSQFKDNIWGVDLADMQSLSKKK